MKKYKKIKSYRIVHKRSRRLTPEYIITEDIYQIQKLKNCFWSDNVKWVNLLIGGHYVYFDTLSLAKRYLNDLLKFEEDKK